MLDQPAGKLVSYQFSIFFGSTSRRHRFPSLYASTLSHSRTPGASLGLGGRSTLIWVPSGIFLNVRVA
jgi:hypothetical protein